MTCQSTLGNQNQLQLGFLPPSPTLLTSADQMNPTDLKAGRDHPVPCPRSAWGWERTGAALMSMGCSAESGSAMHCCSKALIPRNLLSIPVGKHKLLIQNALWKSKITPWIAVLSPSSVSDGRSRKGTCWVSSQHQCIRVTSRLGVKSLTGLNQYYNKTPLAGIKEIYFRVQSFT